jgi:hypothetical protein
MMTPDEFFGALEQMPEPQPVFYRLYHDATGFPLFYSMEDLPGTYIEITAEQYARNDSNVRVRNGALVPVTWQTAQKLTPSDTGTMCHTQDVAIVVKENGTYWSKRTYES